MCVKFRTGIPSGLLRKLQKILGNTFLPQPICKSASSEIAYDIRYCELDSTRNSRLVAR